MYWVTNKMYNVKTRIEGLRCTFCVITLSTVILMLSSCGDAPVASTIVDPETTPTMISHNHRIIESKDGKRSYRFETPLLERFEQAREPYMEFRKGVKIETFADSITIESDVVADYAIFNETTQIWQAKGNVVARNLKDDKQLFTEELFWNRKLKKIYTDKLAKVIDGENTHIGNGFEADEDFKSWTFRKGRGQIEFETAKDSTQTDSTSMSTEPAQLATPQVETQQIKPNAMPVTQKQPEVQPKKSPKINDVKKMADDDISL